MRKVAFTSGGGRKFLYPPALLRVGTKMYVAVGSGNRERPLVTNYPYVADIRNRFYLLLDDLTLPASGSDAAVAMDTDTGMRNYTSTSSTSTAASRSCPSSWPGSSACPVTRR